MWDKRWRPIFGLVGILLGVGLACNLPLDISNPAPPPTRPPITALPQTTPTDGLADPTLPPLPGITDEPIPAQLPTFTPIQPLLAPTLALRDGGTPGGVPAATVTPYTPGVSLTPELTAPPAPVSGGPLGVSYVIRWRIEADKAVARVTLTATGGSAPYRYYHDDLPVSGPTFEYAWTTCNPNPGSFRVDSGDGQSVRINYYEIPPCP